MLKADNINLIETAIDHCPSWAWIVLVAIAFLVSLGVAGMGMRMCAAVFQRVRRSHLS